MHKTRWFGYTLCACIAYFGALSPSWSQHTTSARLSLTIQDVEATSGINPSIARLVLENHRAELFSCVRDYERTHLVLSHVDIRMRWILGGNGEVVGVHVLQGDAPPEVKGCVVRVGKMWPIPTRACGMSYLEATLHIKRPK